MLVWYINSYIYIFLYGDGKVYIFQLIKITIIILNTKKQNTLNKMDNNTCFGSYKECDECWECPVHQSCKRKKYMYNQRRKIDEENG